MMADDARTPFHERSIAENAALVPVPPTGLRPDAGRRAALFAELGLCPLAAPDPFRGAP